jgi:TP901 family phage tail tape measure protein
MPAIIKIQISSASAGSGFEDARRNLKDLDDSARKAGGGFNALTGIVAGATAAVTTAVLNMAATGAQALAGFVKDSITAAGDFEASVNGLAAVTGSALADAGFSLEDVSAKALQLGKDTQFSAQEAILAMTELAKGGVPVQSVMTDATDATLALASAAGVNLPNAAEIVAKQLGVWSETGVTAAQVTDLLASAANASTVGVEDLALGLAQAGGTAKTAGVGFDDLVQTMALIAPNFSSASDAGTSLKTMLSRLIPTTEPAKDAMRELGLYTDEAGSAFFDASGQFVGMEQAAQLLQTATAGLSEEQRLLAFNTIFGQDAIRAAAALANAGAEGFNAMGQAMTDSGGAAAAAAVKQQGYAFAMEQLKGSVETAQIVLGTAFLPIITQVVGQLTEGVNAALGWLETFLKLVPAIQASETPLTTLLNAIGISIPGTMPAMQALIQAWNDLQAPMAAVASVAGTVASFVQANLTPILAAAGAMILAAVIPAFVAWATAAWTTAAANLAALAPILVPIALIGAAAALLAVMWEQNWFGMRDTITAFWDGTGKPIFDQLVTWLGNTITTAIATLTNFWTGTLLPALQGVWAFIQDPLMPLFSALGNVLSAVVGVAVEALAGLWKTTLQPALSAVGSYINDTLQPVMTTIADVLSATVGPAVEGLKKFFDDAKGGADGFKGAVDGVTQFLNTLADTIRNIPTPKWPEPPSWLGGGAGGTGGRAAGGAWGAAFTPRMVGEHGPEIAMLPAGSGIVPATASAAIAQRTTNNYFNMSVSTNARASTVAADYMLMKTLAGVS